jgi:hypothetical protein
MASVGVESTATPTEVTPEAKANVVAKVKPLAKLGYEFGHSRCDFSSTSGNLIKDIEKSPACNQLREFAKLPKSEVKSNCDKNDKSLACSEMDSLIKCAEALLPEKLKATILHELGHNIGLRHNFAASTDEVNFTKKFDEKSLKDLKNYSCPATQAKSGEVLARSNSVMEYTDMNEDRLTFVGPYDVEAIRYGYASKLLDSSCQVKNLDIGKSIDENVSTSNWTKLPIKFCSDDHVGYKMDPLCQMHDSGANPFAV